MSIFFISNRAESAPIVYRLQQEKIDVSIYVHLPIYKDNYSKILPKVRLSEVKTAINDADIIIFDSIKINDNTQEDRALLQIFGLELNNKNIFGSVADVIKERYPDKKVIGASAWTEQLALNVIEGNEYAESLGLTVAEKNNSGIEFSIEGWFDGTNFVHYNCTLENKHMMNGNLGLITNSQGNTVWVKHNKLLLSEFNSMIPDLRKAKYIGPISMDCIVIDKILCFVKWQPCIKYDAIYNLLTLVQDTMGAFFTETFHVGFYNQFACSQRITIPPYPYNNRELLDIFAKDVSIDNAVSDFWMNDIYFNDGVQCTGTDGIIGVVSQRGKDLQHSWNNVYDKARKLHIASNVQYRTDGYSQSNRAIDKLHKRGLLN